MNKITLLLTAALLLASCAKQQPAPPEAWQAVICGDNDKAAFCGWE